MRLVLQQQKVTISRKQRGTDDIFYIKSLGNTRNQLIQHPVDHNTLFFGHKTAWLNQFTPKDVTI